MQHSFDIEIAIKYGTNIALFLNNLAFWIKKNAANNKHFHDGTYWTYNSVEAYQILFPYMKPRAVRTMIEQSINHGLIQKGNYNSNHYDRTAWYALTEKGEKILNVSICQKRQMEKSPLTNEFVSSDKSSYTDINTDNKTISIPLSAEPEKKCRKKPKISLPNDMAYNQSHIDLAKKLNIDVDRALEDFKDHALTNDRRCSDWNAAFRNWIRKANDFRPKVRQEKHFTRENGQNSIKPTQETSYASVESQSTSWVTPEESMRRDREYREKMDRQCQEALERYQNGAKHGSEAKEKDPTNSSRANRTTHQPLYPSMRKAQEYLPFK